MDFGTRWISVEESATYLGVVEETIYRWIDRRGLPAHRIGKFWKFKVREIDLWVKSGGAADVDYRDSDKFENVTKMKKKSNQGKINRTVQTMFLCVSVLQRTCLCVLLIHIQFFSSLCVFSQAHSFLLMVTTKKFNVLSLFRQAPIVIQIKYLMFKTCVNRQVCVL